MRFPSNAFLCSALILLACLPGGPAAAQEGGAARVYGKILDQDRYPVEYAAVVVAEDQRGVTADHLGRYEIEVPAGRRVTLAFASLGYKTATASVEARAGERARLDVTLEQLARDIAELTVVEERSRHTNAQHIDPALAREMPSMSDPVMDIIKSLPGVASNNDMSSQYSVRGGNYDENLIYVDGIEIHKPFLVRSGQQEGLNFVNSDMVGSLSFSSGGFEARYGDKMSSVLDIGYKRPSEFAAKAEAGLMGGSATVEAAGAGGRLSLIASGRYKQMRLALGSLDTKGDYSPSFLDFQAYATYDVNERLELGLLAYVADNRYVFEPSTRETTSGTFNNAMRFKIYFDGHEVDRFSTSQGAVALRYRPDASREWRATLSTFHSLERESFDIQGQYWLNQVDANIGSSTLGDSIGSLAVGTYLDHARNRLDALVTTATVARRQRLGRHSLQCGAELRHSRFRDRINEWMMLDSADYSVPYHGWGDTLAELSATRRYANNTASNALAIYAQDTWRHDIDSATFTATYGARVHYWDFNREWLFSPRATLALKPHWRRDFLFRLSAGVYYQPPMYKEFVLDGGALNADIRSPKSVHLVGAADYNFAMWGRPFKLVAETYYKKLSDIIPYTVDNVRILYDGRNHADGYAAGVDLKITGDFVKGAESWLSLSLMRTEEDIRDDMFVVFGENGAPADTVRPGFIPRPTDQRFMANLFFQDYLPGNPTWKVHLNAIYNTGLPFGPPASERYLATLRLPSYTRVDIGCSKQVAGPHADRRWLTWIKSLWVGVDVFNLFNTRNVLSYTWVTDIYGIQHAIPNKMTGRLFSAKISATF